MLRCLHHFCMRQFALFFTVFIWLFFSGAAFGQTLISWNPVSTGAAGPNPYTPGFLNASLTSPTNGIARGSSLTSNGTSGTYGGPAGSGGYLNVAGAGTITGTSADDVKSLKFSIRAACGTISLSSIQGATRRSGTGPQTVNVYYALNGATTHTLIGTWNTSATSGTTGTAGNSILTGISALQNIPAGTTIEFIFTPNGTGGGSGGTWYFTNSDLSLSGTVTPVAAPTIGVAPANTSVPEFSGTTFSVGTVAGATSYQWQRNTSGTSGGTWVNITSASFDPAGTYAGFATTSTATSNTLTLTNVPASWNGYGYRCVVTNCAGSTNSNPALLTVIPASCIGTPATGSVVPVTASFCGSGSTTLALSGGSSGAGITYQWSSSNTSSAPGTDIPGATSATYTSPTLTNTIYYWVTTTCTTSSVSSVSSVGVVTVNPVPVVSVTPPGGNYCTATPGLDMTASGAATYSWAPAAGLSATTGANVTATPAVVTIYTVVGTSPAGCIGSATVTVNNLTPPASIAGLSSLCLATSIPLSNAVSGGTWSSSNSAVATIHSTTGLLTSTTPGITVVSYTTGCGADATATITAVADPGAISGASSVCSGMSTPLSNAATGGTWSSNNTVVVTVSATGVVTGGAPGIAVINYSTGCGTDATFTITTIAPPSSISGASSACVGFTTPLSNAVAGGVWSSNNTSVATVAATGLVTAGIAGVATIRYSTGCGTDATQVVNVISAPLAIGGAATVCVGANTTLSQAITGGTWTSSNTAVATVSATGIVFGAGAGTAIINYSTGCGTDVSHTITAIASPSPIAGPASVCSGLTAQVSNTVAGGIWSSSVTMVATVNAATGVVTAGLAGNTTISYSTGCGITPIHALTVIAAPTAIGGAATVCSGLTAQLSEAVLGGTWSSSATAVATVTTTGLITGGAAGTAVINYSTGCGADVSHTITTITAPAAIGGAATVCTGAATQLSQSVAMGTWSSSNTNVATVNGAGLVTGIIAGPVIITYATGCGTGAAKALAVIASPAAISGASSVCNGFNIQLSNTVAGGTWSSSNAAVATVNSTGLVASASAGTSVIRYATGCGTDATKTISVIAAPATITGSGTVCSGDVTHLANASAGGTWSSSNSGVATIDVFGNVWAANQGSTVIRYATGCGADATRTVTVLVAPGGIAGFSSVCIGLTLALSNVTAGGAWTSSNTSVATVNGSGLVTTVTPGATTITYSTGCGLDQVKPLTVIPNPGIISGPSAVCAAGGVVTLSNTVAGGGWSSNSTPVATVNVTGDVTGGLTGMAVISYTTGCGTDATTTISVTPIPAATLGTTSVCPGAGSTLTNSAAGGVWSSDNTTVATVDASGTVHAIVPGIANIIYSTGCGADASVPFIVNSSPATPMPVLGTATVCFGSSTALSSFTPGGVWSSDNTSVATVDGVGVVSTITTGTVNISYTVTNMCGSASSSALVTAESPLTTIPAITGPTSFCEGTFVTLSNTMTGGAWSSDNVSIATINSAGLAGGVAAGTATIAYTVSNTCNTASVTTLLTINPLPAPAPIIGSTAPFCEGTTIALSDPTPGGVWSSNLTTIATVNSTGVVTGVSGGSSTIFYSLTNGCGTVASILIVTIDPMPVLSPVTGNLVVCAGATTQLSDTATTGAWSSGNSAVAIVSNTGLVTGLFAGVVPISYSAVNSCGTIASVASVTVTTAPMLGPITGPSTVCIGSSINLANALPGGTWSTDVIAVANVNNFGVVVGLMAGIDTIRYLVINSCGTSMVAKGIEVLPASACDPVKVGGVPAEMAELKVFPNPNSGAFTWILHSSTNESVEVVMTDMMGRVVKRFTAITNKDNNTILDVPGGVYFLAVRTLAGTYNAKITISR